jgi:hypothetical protein
MGSASIWHWLIVLLSVAFPVIVVATERSSKRASRSMFALGLGIVLFYAGLPDVLWLFYGFQLGDFLGLFWLIGITLTIWFYRLTVQRARDAGHSKAIAYWACVPVLNLLIYLYLLFPRGKADVPAMRAFD